MNYVSAGSKGEWSGWGLHYTEIPWSYKNNSEGKKNHIAILGTKSILSE